MAKDVGQADPRLPEVQGEEGRKTDQSDLLQAQGRRLVLGPLRGAEAERRQGLGGVERLHHKRGLDRLDVDHQVDEGQQEVGGGRLTAVDRHDYEKGEQTMKIRPLYDRILVKRIEEQNKTAGGLYIPDTAKEKPQEALVVAVGNGKVIEDGSLRKLEVKAGDKILFSKYSGNEIKIDGTEHLILREDDILAVID